jgi:predicted PurR-regulated permease PerM
MAERVVTFRPRTLLTAVALLLGIAAALWVVWIARRVVLWALVSLFLALALNPAVEALQRRGIRRRGAAAAVVYLVAVLVIAGIGALIVPTVIQQVNDLVDAAPGYVSDLTAGRGPLGFLETKYHVVERVEDAVQGNASGQLAGGASAALDVARTVVTFVVGVITIAFMTFFMLLEGPTWVERLLGLVPEGTQPRWRDVANEIYRTVGGYVTGNLLISVIAGASATVVLLALGVPFALALGLLVAILDLIPLAGATLAAIVVSLVAFTHSLTAGIAVLAFFIVYQQLENHLLQPVVYGRTVKLSPLVVLISVLVGAEVAGIIGALGAIPIAGTIQILLLDWLAVRRARRTEAVLPATHAPTSSGDAHTSAGGGARTVVGTPDAV